MRHLRRSVSTTAVVPRRTSVRTTPHLHRSIDESPRSLRRRPDAGSPAAACGHSDRRRRAAGREDWRTHLRARPLDRAPHRGDRGEVSRGEWIRRDRGIQSRPATGPVEPSPESPRSKRRRHQPSRRSNTAVQSSTRSRSTPLRRPPSRGDEPRCSIDRSRLESNPRSPDFEVLEVAIPTRKRREPPSYRTRLRASTLTTCDFRTVRFKASKNRIGPAHRHSIRIADAARRTISPIKTSFFGK